MSQSETRILTKKSSNHPKDFNRNESYEEVYVNDDQKEKTKVDIFLRQDLFLNDTKKTLKTTQQVTNTQPQKQRNPIASREVVKRMINQKRRKQQKAKLSQMNLSLIQQTQSEYNLSSSSQSNSVVDQSSIDRISSEGVSSESESNDDKFNEGFLVQQEGQQNDALNKTVIMSKKKVPRREFQTPRTPQKLTQKQKLQLQIFAKKHSLDTLQAFHLQGKLNQIEYLHLLQTKKQEERRIKEEKYFDNLQKINKHANTIDLNYDLIEKKLCKDIEKDRLKIQTLTQNIIEINKKKEKKSKLPNPEQSQLQLKILEVIAQQNAKQNFFQILKKARQDFRLEYNKSMHKIQDIKKNQLNISQNLIFIEIKQILKKNQQNYQYLASSLVNNRKNKKSLIAYKARQNYLKLLKQKYVEQLIKIQEFKDEDITNEATKLLRSSKDSQISQEILIKLFKSAQQKVSEKLHFSKQKFLYHLSWLRMVHKGGQLQEGKMFKESVWILANNIPLNISISDQKQKYLIQNFKFYRRKVFKILQSQFQTFKKVYDSFLTKQAYQWQKAQDIKKQMVLKKTDFLEKKVNILESLYEKNEINSILFFKKPSQRSHQNNGYFDILKKKILKMIEQEDKAKILLQFQAPRIIPKKRLLIPSKKVTKMDLRTQLQEIQSPKQTSLIQKLNSRYKICHKPEYIKAQLEKDEQSFQNLSKSMKKIDLKKQVFEDVSQLEDKKYSDLEKKNHMDKVYELIIKNQITKSYLQQKLQSHEPYYVPREWEIRQSYLSKTKYTHECHIRGSPQTQFQEFLRQQKKLSKPNIMNRSHQSFQSLNQKFSFMQIEQACKQFTREFYLNPNLSNQLNLTQEQFYFLASPQYRKFCLDKKVKDQLLQDKILTLIRNNPYPINQSRYQCSQQNPVNLMIQTDPYFQQRIQQYQDKIVKNQQFFDPYQLKPVCQSQYSDYSSRESISSLFDPFEERVHEIQKKRSLNYWSQNKSDFGTVASEHQQFQQWLSNRY